MIKPINLMESSTKPYSSKVVDEAKGTYKGMEYSVEKGGPVGWVAKSAKGSYYGYTSKEALDKLKKAINSGDIHKDESFDEDKNQKEVDAIEAQVAELSKKLKDASGQEADDLKDEIKKLNDKMSALKDNSEALSPDDKKLKDLHKHAASLAKSWDQLQAKVSKLGNKASESDKKAIESYKQAHADVMSQIHALVAKNKKSESVVGDSKEAKTRSGKLLSRLEVSEELGEDRSTEGSRGGKVIGHTRSGKPIYDEHEHEGHADFSKADHNDAHKLHLKLSDAADKKHNLIGSKEGEHNFVQSVAHRESAKKTGKQSMSDFKDMSAKEHKDAAEKHKGHMQDFHHHMANAKHKEDNLAGPYAGIYSSEYKKNKREEIKDHKEKAKEAYKKAHSE